jgi:hypothetical protein
MVHQSAWELLRLQRGSKYIRTLNKTHSSAKCYLFKFSYLYLAAIQ